MDHNAEIALAQVEQFKRDRWPYVIGHVGATAAIIAVSWSIADQRALLWFGVSTTGGPLLELDELLRDSDRAMYRSKGSMNSGGRRRGKASEFDTEIDIDRSAA